MVWAGADFKRGGFDISAGAIFYIDVGSTRVLPSGPGTGIRIRDFRYYGGKYMPPEGLDAVEPYAYDVFAMTQTFSYLTAVSPRTSVPPSSLTGCCASILRESTQTNTLRAAGMTGTIQ